jgi:heme exporter protein C
MKINWFKYASPAAFYPVAGRLVPVFGALALALVLFSLYWGFFETPERLGGSNPQKEYYRIIFIHVPSAWMSMWLYLVLAVWSGDRPGVQHPAQLHDGQRGRADRRHLHLHRTLDRRLLGPTELGHLLGLGPAADLGADPVLPVHRLHGAALGHRRQPPRRPRRRLLAIVGLVMLPIIFWSINCPDPNNCAALHQRSSLKKIESNILTAMLTMTLGFWLYSFATAFSRCRASS